MFQWLQSIDPVAFSVGSIKVHWYGIMYLVGFASAWGLALWRQRHGKLDWTSEQISDFIFYSALGVILGGRIGYMLFYNTSALLDNPLSLFKIWEGGMSFHGGLLGVAIALWFFSRHIHRKFLAVGDLAALLVPIGLGLGRLGNFINGELCGRETDVSWAMVCPGADEALRHPSQLYEFGLEGIFLFILLWCYAAKPRPTGRVSALFLMGYGLCRFVVEFFRTPDVQIGFVAFDWLTMGQILSIPMFFLGIYLWWARR